MRGPRRRYEEQATHTRVRLTFYSFDDDGFSGVVDGYHPEFGFIVGCSTSKSFGGAAGSFSITVKKPQEKASVLGFNLPGIGVDQSWTHLWADPEGTWLLIQWVCDGEVIDDSLCVIDNISEGEQRQGAGERSETYTITGRDFGRVFEQTQAFINVYDQDATVGIAGIFQRLHSDVAGPPGRFVEALIEAWIGNYEGVTQPWRLPLGLGGVGFYNILQRKIGCQDEEIDGYTADMTLVSPDQDGKNLWSLMQEFSNGLMNELWVDLAPPPERDSDSLTGLVPTVIMRRKPFKTRNDTQRWSRLTTRQLKMADVRNRNISKGGPAHRFNYWILDVAGRQDVGLQSILQKFNNEPGRPGSIPIWNLASIEKHGLRPWRQATQFLPISSRERGSNFAMLAANWLNRLHDWYAVAPFQLSGTLQTTRVRPDIRVGQRVREQRPDGVITFYVEGISTTWTYGQGGSSTVTVTRGEYDGEDHLERLYDELNRSFGGSARCLGEPSRDDELIAQLADGCFDLPQTISVDASGDISGEGLVGPDVAVAGLVSEGAQRDVDADLALTQTQTDSPSEIAARRAFRGESHQVVEGVTDETGDVSLTQEELEAGDPIEIPETSDPLAGIEEDL